MRADEMVNLLLKIVLYGLLCLGAVLILFSVGMTYLSGRQENRKKQLARLFDAEKYEAVFRASVSMISLPSLPAPDPRKPAGNYYREKTIDHWWTETEELLQYATRSAAHLSIDAAIRDSLLTLVARAKALVEQWYAGEMPAAAEAEWQQLSVDLEKIKANLKRR